MNTTATANKVDDDLMGAIHDAFNSRDVDRIISFFADDGVFSTATGPHPYGERYVGKAAIAKFLSDRFKSIPDMSWEHKYRYVCGNRGVSYWVVTGKNAAGKEINLHGCDLYDFKDGKIVYKDTFWKSVV